MQRILILGAGTAGTMMANRLVKVLPASWRVTVLDRDDEHVYQPGLLFLPFGMYRDDELTRPRHRTVDPRVELRLAEIDRIDPAARTVSLLGGERIAYDWLIVATGSRILPESTPGLTGPGWHDTASDFYTLDGARALRAALDRFTGGRLVVNVAEMPIKCPVAPLEFLFLAEAFFTERGLRDKVEIVYTTPLEGAFTKPVASAHLGGMLAERGIGVVGDFAIAEVDGQRRVVKAYDGREEPYDLLVTIPIHGGAQVITDSKLGDLGGWMPTDKHTLAARGLDRVFVIGDATDLPASKAGAVAHFQSDVLVDNLLRAIAGRPLVPEFDGHANCFIETGHGKAMLIDFNYTTEPLPGKFPLPGLGPFTLLGESEVNHWGKLAFKWIYWNLLLAGKELPLDHRMLLAGKQVA
ncbi:MAG: NAD(P)/FAD-dependent oxidoreductase [Kofleriaceae bacterium]|jgi:sulfide:quinone oxidoreductase|nr:NAD(P)/FAD-dependent oxidoreductase [Kofleriaceae bacterium]MBP9169553.1 NAD(P)/FAD-dependent oxidoreductase [Kofleriaceae bacterium]MBP9859198.1 NAD(P)/FAD-dependent oxidoreductase [Kofleriaceae bacterium]